MVLKKVDDRVRHLIEAGVKTGHRSMFVLVGDHGKDQVENLHKILAKTRVRSRPSVLWCYKKELGFSTHRQKRMRQIKKMQARGLHDTDQEDPFDLFISTTDIRWTYYKDTEKVLGQTFGMVVLQDFEALTPNTLARTIETVEGGGLVILLLRTVKSLKQLYTMTMDVHSRFRTESCDEIVPRFNERFILSLASCNRCLVLDDELNILPISSDHCGAVESVSSSHNNTNVSGGGSSEWESSVHAQDPELVALKASLEETPTAGALVGVSKTVDQAKAILSFLDAISEKTMRSTVALTAGRGRGKSAAIGLCLAGAIAYGYSNIFVTAPSPENLKTTFDFVVSGLKELKFVEHIDFETVTEHCGDLGKVIVRVNVFREHRQTIQYIKPNESHKLSQAELVAIDEAAAIPLPIMKELLGNYLVFISSTVNGYEGTGRALSLKLIAQLRQNQAASQTRASIDAGASVSGNFHKKKGEQKLHEERWKASSEAAGNSSSGGMGARGRVLTELSLETPIRYNAGDAVEKWLNDLLCLDIVTHSTRIVSSLPAPGDCDLFLIDRDALFSYHPLSERLLQRIWALYTSAHYKNTPNDLHMLSDAPAHRLFVLLGPQNAQSQKPSKSGAPALPDILCVVQVAFEGRISQKTVQAEMARGNKASGDMIPWTISQQYNDTEFATLSGARIVRIATHPDVQGMGYGSRAVDLLVQYFQGDIVCSSDLPAPAPGELGGESGAPSANRQQDMSASTGKLADEDDIAPRQKLPPLLTALHERPAERLHWLGVGFGLTSQLLGFWNRKGFLTTYLRQTSNETTGEYSCIVLKEMSINLENSNPAYEQTIPNSDWLSMFVEDYRRRLISLLSFNFKDLPIALAMTLVDPNKTLTSTNADIVNEDSAGGDASSSSSSSSALVVGSGATGLVKEMTAEELTTTHCTLHDIKRLELYSRNMVDHHMVMDLIPTLTRLLFTGRLVAKGCPALRFSHLQVAVLCAIGLQHKSVDAICKELDLPSNQVLAFFNKTVRKLSSWLHTLVSTSVAAAEMTSTSALSRQQSKLEGMKSLSQTLSQDLKEQSSTPSASNKLQHGIIMDTKDLSKHTLGGSLLESDQLESSLIQSQRVGVAMPHVVSAMVVKGAEKGMDVDYKDRERGSDSRHGSAKKSKHSGSGGSGGSAKKSKHNH